MNMLNIKPGMRPRQYDRLAPNRVANVRRTLAQVDEVLRKAAQSAKAKP